MPLQASAGAVLYAKSIDRVRPFYEQCCGLKLVHSQADHVVLESQAFQLVIVAIPAAIADSITIANPPLRREDTPIKLFFPVGNIDAVRELAAGLDGEIYPHDREWSFEGRRICDGQDPEGNVVQLREQAPER